MTKNAALVFLIGWDAFFPVDYCTYRSYRCQTYILVWLGWWVNGPDTEIDSLVGLLMRGDVCVGGVGLCVWVCEGVVGVFGCVWEGVYLPALLRLSGGSRSNRTSRSLARGRRTQPLHTHEAGSACVNASVLPVGCLKGYTAENIKQKILTIVVGEGHLNPGRPAVRGGLSACVRRDKTLQSVAISERS